MNEFQQAFSRSEGLWRGNVLWIDCWNVDYAEKSLFLFSIFFEVVLNQENLDNQTQYHPQQIFCNLKSLYERYKQIHTRGSLGFISQVYISHMICGHFMRRACILMLTTDITYNVYTQVLLIVYFCDQLKLKENHRKMLEILKL